MLRPTDIAVLVLNGVFSVIGLMGNAFIATVNVIKWMKGFKMNASNIIVSSLAVTNIFLQCSWFARAVCNIYWKEIFLLDEVVKVNVTVVFGLCSSSLWFATWLGVYYCLKIVNFNHQWFICMKERFLKIVPGLLIGSVVVSLAICIAKAFDIQEENATNQASNNSENTSSIVSSNGTMNECLSGNGPSTLFMIQMLVGSVAFVMFSFSAAAIITSLCRHMQRMAQNADSFRSPNLKAHLGALKSVTMLLVFYLIFYVAQVLINLEVDIKEGFSFKRLSFVFPALSALILILGNTNLKMTVIKIFYQSFCFKREV